MSGAKRGRRPVPVEEPSPVSRPVLLVGNPADWPSELVVSLAADGHATRSVPDLSLVLSLLADGGVGALFVLARPLGASELLALRRVREASPRTAIVALATRPTDPDVKRAFESGATAFLSWPASPAGLRHAIESGSGAGPAPHAAGSRRSKPLGGDDR